MTSVRPSVVIVGGVNGSGKSTFAQRAAGTDLLLGQVAINPDELSKQAKLEMPSLNDPVQVWRERKKQRKPCGERSQRAGASQWKPY